MIYVIQEENVSYRNPVIYAGSSAHEALLAASKVSYCKVSVYKNGKRFRVAEQQDQTKGCSDNDSNK